MSRIRLTIRITAPFRVSYLSETMTWVPLSLVAINSIALILKPPAQAALSRLPPGELFAATYLGPTTEESVMRGWLMPVSMQYFGSEWASNVLAATVFAAYHIPAYGVPWSQFLGGLYLGYQTQRNGWAVGESIFLHSWWNFLVFLPGAVRHDPTAQLNFPTITLRF